MDKLEWLKIPCIQKAIESMPANGFLVWSQYFPMSVKAYARSEDTSCPRHAAERFGFDDLDNSGGFFDQPFEVLVYSDRKDTISEFRISLSYVVKAELVKDA